MLEVARRRLPSTVRLVSADAIVLPFADHSFAVAVSSSSYHFWSSPVQGLQEIARVLQPGGRLVLTDWCDDYLACRLYDRVLRLTSASHPRIYGEARCRAHLSVSGFTIASLERYRIGWLWGMMTAAAQLTEP